MNKTKATGQTTKIILILTFVAAMVAIINLVLQRCDVREQKERTQDRVKGESGLLTNMEFSLCDTIKKEQYCPFNITIESLGDLIGVSEKDRNAIFGLYQQVLSYKEECESYQEERRRGKLLSLYGEARRLRKDVRVVVGEGEYIHMGIPPNGKSYGEAAEDCFNELRNKGVVKEVSKR